MSNEASDTEHDHPAQTSRRATMAGRHLYAGGALFFSGATALIFEVLWSRQFVTVFGNSSYAISIVLCAFMAGLGIGGWLGGRLADRFRARLLIYGLILAGVALWALLVPTLLDVLRRWVPRISLLAPDSLLTATVARFVISFAILLVPCLLMGATLPVLVRFCTESRDVVGRRVSLLYGLNTLGAAAGCFAAGYWLIDTLGLRWTNNVAVGINLLIAAVMLALARSLRGTGPSADAPTDATERAPEAEVPALEAAPAGRSVRGLLVAVAFLSGLAALSCEVLWMRYLAFFSNVAYAFTAILGTFLLGLGAGSLLCRLFLARCGRPLLLLAGIELLLGLTILACFSAGALVYTALAPAPLKLLPMTAITVLLPTVLMGAAFPLICAAFTASVETVGRSIGVVYAVNTAGSIVGSLIPVFVLIPLFGIQPSLLLAALLYGAASVALFWAAQPRRQLVWVSGAVAAVGASAVAFAIAVPPDLCARVLLATSPDLGRHTEVAFYREGRTGTAVVLRDRVNDTKVIYINSTGEVPTTYDSMYCFKLMGILGPLLHPNPDEVLMICFGGGIAAGAAVQFPDVKSLEVVDLESSVVEAARTMEEENNGLLRDPKVQITIDDGRNYILTSRRNWPVIVTDSTHPKSSDSWVLYTREFYRTLKEHLAADGVLVQWLPMHNLSVTEYKVILRTFQSVFPHASLWLSNAVTETGEYAAYTLLVATANRLTIDLDQLKRKLAVEAIASDLQPYGLQSPVGVLDAFVCAEETLRRWTADGPTNTDDLPYTQYETRYSPGIRCTAGTFLSPMESVAPYLRHTGTEQETRRLHQELGLHMEANKLALMGKMKRAVALLPNDTRLRKCVENRELGKRYVRELAEYYPDDVPMLIYLGRKAETLPAGADDALALYRKALAIDAGNTRALNSLADLLIRRGALEEGVGHLRRVLDLEPDNAGALHNMGLVLSNLGRIEEAISYYKRALEVEPRHVKARCNLAVALAGRGRTDEAIAQLAEALRTNPYLADAHNNMGVFLASQNHLHEAAEHLHLALQARPDHVDAKCNLAEVLSRQGRYDEAVALLSEALWIDPEDIGARRSLEQLQRHQAEAGVSPPE